MSQRSDVRSGRPTSRVLHVITDTDRRGAQVFAADLCSALTRDGRPGAVRALRHGGPGARLDVPVLGAGARDLPTLHRLRREMAASTVVVAHGSSTLLACGLAGAGLRVPVVYRNISDPAYWLRSAARRARVRLLLSRMDRVVALWPGGADFLVRRLGVSADKVAVIPNSVHAAAFRPPSREERVEARRRLGLPQDAPVLLYVAALQPEKHPEAAVRSLAELPVATHLVVLGDGPRRAAVAALGEQLAPRRVHLLGRVDSPRDAYWAADVVVLPSEGEGLPAVLIEAGLCGLPAVASTSGGCADIVRDGHTGYVVPPDDPGRLAGGVRRALSRRTALGAGAESHCRERYDLGAVARQWRELLDGLVTRTEPAS